MHYTGLTIYLHFLSSVKYLYEKKKLKFSQIVFPSLLSLHRIVITKQKKKKVAGMGGGRGEGACSNALVEIWSECLYSYFCLDYNYTVFLYTIEN